MIDILKIKEALPHRYPMLLVDRVLEVSEDEIVALKNVTINEPFFNGHFQTILLCQVFSSWRLWRKPQVSWNCPRKKIRASWSFMPAWTRLNLSKLSW